MATKTEIRLIDDLDGGPADETLPFSVDGIDYEIDLSDPNAKKLREDFGHYISKARRVGGRKTGKARANGTSPNGSQLPTAEIRQWAKDNGRQISERGRIPQEVVTAWEQR